MIVYTESGIGVAYIFNENIERPLTDIQNDLMAQAVLSVSTGRNTLKIKTFFGEATIPAEQTHRIAQGDFEVQLIEENKFNKLKEKKIREIEKARNNIKSLNTHNTSNAKIEIFCLYDTVHNQTVALNNVTFYNSLKDVKAVIDLLKNSLIEDNIPNEDINSMLSAYEIITLTPSSSIKIVSGK